MHTCRLWFVLGFVACLVSPFQAADVTPPKPSPDARFGNVLYKTPDPGQWSVHDGVDRRVFALPLTPPDFCRLTVFAGGNLAGDFAAAFDRAVQASLSAVGTDPIVRDSGAQAGQAAEGFPVLQRRVLTSGAGRSITHWFLAGNSGGRFDLLAYQASSDALFEQNSDAATEFFRSAKLANSLPAAAVNIAPPVGRSSGPLAAGDRVEVPWGGGWEPAIVLHAEGLHYFVHMSGEWNDGKYDDFLTLNLIRPPGGPKTFAETYRETVPDPEGGPVPLGSAVEYFEGAWFPARVARRLGDRYIVFTDKPGVVTEQWVTPDKLRLPGHTTPLEPTRANRQRQPPAAADLRLGDLLEGRPRRGSWGQFTLLSRQGQNYFVKAAPNTGLSLRGWVDLSRARPVGGKLPFQSEDLGFFVGTWNLSGDSFQNLVARTVAGSKATETYRNNSGAGQGAGRVVIRADGTYELSRTVVFHDGKGKWERNPDQDEGGILLRGADGKGAQDCVVTNHLDGFAYLQGAIRGPGKWCTRSDTN